MKYVSDIYQEFIYKLKLNKMKTIKFFAIAIIGTGLFLSCSKEKDTPQPEPQTVYVCQDSRYTGANCDQQKKPKKITVTKVVLSSFSRYKTGTANWDDCCDYGDYRPDVIIQLYEGTPRPGSFQFGLPAIWDANYNQSYAITQDNLNQFPFELSLNTSYTVTVEDSDLGTDESMGTSIIQSYSSTNGFPEILYANTGKATVEMHLSYEF